MNDTSSSRSSPPLIVASRTVPTPRLAGRSRRLLDQLTESIGLVLNTIEANTLTENLLKQSQSQAEELRSQQDELRESNEDLGRQARQLAEQNIEAEQRNRQVEQSKLQVEEKVGQLAVSSKYKSQFIANMSHELRTPLNSLLILAEQLEANPERNMTEVQVEYASVIRSSGKDLLELLNAILDLAKAESGTVTPDMSEVSLDSLRGVLLREFEHVAQGKGLDYVIDVAPNSPRVIVTDAQRLRQILTNLLANALKFTEHGEVRLQFGIAADGWSRERESLAEAPAVLAIAVSDTGIGIGEAEQQQIFEAFAQGDGGTSRAYGGTGLGLSISRELVGLLGGEITVTSTSGQGSTFTVYLPADPAVAATSGAAPTGALPAAQPFAPRRAPSAAAVETPEADTEARRPGGPISYDLGGVEVLVVDDDFRNIFALTALLERGAAEVTSAESGLDAITALEEAPDTDLVLMDIMMPIMDGYATIRSIRAFDRFKSLPIIAVTAKVMGGEHQRCLDAGANDYVPKPVDTSELIEVLRP